MNYSQGLIRAVQYVRMSTENQSFSIRNQSQAIAIFAAERGYEIVRTYADEARSGLTIAGREALGRLIADVHSGSADFSAILVYDISRWGRFQDTDESAHYEFICRRAGISVHYCAERFDNDGSPTATLIKSIKRLMAAEYSRELSSKVAGGQRRLASMGYHQGGPAGYGFRRLLVDEHGRPKGIMTPGEHKNIQRDRVVLVPGPPAEAEIIRRIFHEFTAERRYMGQIANSLNEDSIEFDGFRPWSRDIIRFILTREIYIGNSVYNKTSVRLGAARVFNPEGLWVRREGVFTAIVEKEVFAEAQHLLLQSQKSVTNEEMLDVLRDLLRRHGKLTQSLIELEPNAPSPFLYRTRFGGMAKAYEAAGYSTKPDLRSMHLVRPRLQIRLRHLTSISDELEKLGRHVSIDFDKKSLLVDEKFSLSVILSTWVRKRDLPRQWIITRDATSPTDLVVAIRFGDESLDILGYYLIPARAFGHKKTLCFNEQNQSRMSTYRVNGLADLYAMFDGKDDTRSG